MFGFELPTPPPPFAGVGVLQTACGAGSPSCSILWPAGSFVRYVPTAARWKRPKTPAATPYTCVAPSSGRSTFTTATHSKALTTRIRSSRWAARLDIAERGRSAATRSLGPCRPTSMLTAQCSTRNFLQLEYRHFLDQIGFVPGMAAHMRSSFGPYGLILEWNGAISDANFTDDAGNLVSIRPSAWQVSLNYQFDWNPTVEVIGRARHLSRTGLFREPGSVRRHTHRRPAESGAGPCRNCSRTALLHRHWRMGARRLPRGVRVFSRNRLRHRRGRHRQFGRCGSDAVDLRILTHQV